MTWQTIFLIAAPFAGADGWSGEGFEPRKALGADFPVGLPIRLYHGSAEETAQLDLYAKAIPQAVTLLLKHKDHQLSGDLGDVASTRGQIAPL